MKILFVCLGNICRSVTAEEIFRTKLKAARLEKNYEVDSAGLIDYHEGELADPRMRDHAFRRGYRLTHLSRPVVKSDFKKFDLIVAMDDNNVKGLLRLAPAGEEHKIVKMVNFLQQYDAAEIPDPYYGGADGFEKVIDLLEDACEGLLNSLQ